MTDATRLDPEQLAAYFALMEVSNLLEHAVEQQLRDDGGLSTPQFSILATLSGAPGGRLRMTDLADRLVHSRSGVTYQAGQLEKRDLVRRTPAVDDERSVEISLTATGRELIDTVLTGHVELVRRLMMDELNRDEVATLNALLGRVRDRMRSAPPRSAKPRAKKKTD